MAYYRLFIFTDTFYSLSQQSTALLDEANQLLAEANQARTPEDSVENLCAKLLDDEKKRAQRLFNGVKLQISSSEQLAECKKLLPLSEAVLSKLEESVAKRREAAEVGEKIGAMLEQQAENSRLSSIKGEKPDTSNPFPDWIRSLIEDFGAAKFDKMNAEYKVTTAALDDDASDKEFALFKAKVEKAAEESPERKQWYDSHPIKVSTTFDDETKAMDELEVHLGGKPGGVGAKTKRRK